MAEFLRDPQNNGVSSTNGMGEAEEPIQGHLAADPSSSRPYSEVLKEFTSLYFSTSPEDYDEELLDAYLEEMDRLSPLKKSFDSQASLEEFHRRFPALFEEQIEESMPIASQSSEGKPHRYLRRFIAVVATVAAIMATLVTAQALGVDIFGFFARWTEDVFFFDSGQDIVQESRVYPMAEGDSAKYKSIGDALSAFGIAVPLAPSWIPDYFGDWEVTGSVMPYGMRLFAFTKSESTVMTWEASEFSSQDGPAYVIEKNSKDVQQYESHGQIHYIMEDNGCYKVTWVVDNIQCIISGFITSEELTKVIDSIYEVI